MKNVRISVSIGVSAEINYSSGWLARQEKSTIQELDIVDIPAEVTEVTRQVLSEVQEMLGVVQRRQTPIEEKA
jgi:hypothetical protein